MNVKKQVISACLAGTMLLGTAMPAMAVSVDQLTDVKKTDWFYSAVEYVAQKDYMIGVTDDLFAPYRDLSRAMFVTILHRLDGEPSVDTRAIFKDVPADAWCADSVSWAVQNGIVYGFNEEQFAPDAPVTRQQMCVMMIRFLDYRAKKDNVTFKTTNQAKTFLDAASIGDFAKDAVKRCQMLGLMFGDEAGNFNPQANATRAQVAVVIQRLDTLLANAVKAEESESEGGSGGGGGGGGGGDKPTPPTAQTANYVVKATVNVPDKVSTTDPELMAAYNNVTIDGTTVTNDPTFAQVVNALVSGTENENTLKNAVNEALNKVKGKSVTQTVNGQKATIKISEGGVISASVSVNVTDLTSGAQTFAMRAVTQDQLEALIAKLQKGGAMTFSKNELVAMDDLITKAQEVQDMDQGAFDTKVEQIVAEKPELKQVVSGLTLDAVQQAAEDYKGQMEAVLQETLDKAGVSDVESLDDDFVSEKIVKEPVVMNVQLDLGTYLTDAVNKFNSSKASALDRMEKELYPDGSKTIDKDQAGALYDLNNPANYVTDNGNGTLTLKAASVYVNLIKSNVTDSMAFYESLDEDAAFYESLLNRVQSKYQDGYGVTYTGSVADAAALMGDKDGMLVNESLNFRNSTTFSITVTASEDTYDSWLDLITGKFSQADGILPGEMPSILANMLGEYTITLNVTKQ